MVTVHSVRVCGRALKMRIKVLNGRREYASLNIFGRSPAGRGAGLENQ